MLWIAAGLSSILLVAWKVIYFLFFFNDTATTEIYTLSLHDALPIYSPSLSASALTPPSSASSMPSYSDLFPSRIDRKSTRLNSSHGYISYAVFCLKKKKNPEYRACARRELRYFEAEAQPHITMCDLD